MKTKVIAVVAASLCALPALGAVGVSISIGEPNFYGQLDVGGSERPRVISSRPVVIENRYRNLAPVYVRVPASEQKNWRRYCARYDACARPVLFVRDDWYRKDYAPRYISQHPRHDDRKDDRHDDRRDDNSHRDDHNDHDNRRN